MEAIGEIGFSADLVRAVFLTHIHLDHAGGAGWWAASQGVPLYVHTRGGKHLIDPSRLEESARMVYGDKFDGLWGGLTPAPEDQVRTLSDGDTVEIAGIEVCAVDTPGHAFHHLAFQIGTVVFAGDAVGARFPGTLYTSVTSAPPQFHLEHTLASLSKIEALRPSAIYPTHFGPLVDPVPHLNRYRSLLESSVSFIKEAVDSGMSAEQVRAGYEKLHSSLAGTFVVASDVWEKYQAINGTGMCADGIRIYCEKQA